MNNFIAPSVKTLESERQVFDCSPELIRAIWKAENLDELAAVYPAVDGSIIPRYGRLPGLRQAKREALNAAAGFHGVEYLGYNRRTCKRVYYLNAGDPYVTTLIFQGNYMSISCWGDMVESGAIVERGA